MTEGRSGRTADRRPNVVLINCDDLGYGDLGCYGSPRNATPALDRMAADGLRFDSFYMASPVCSPSRGALLTGCYPPRIGFGAFDGLPVLFPGQRVGLPSTEISLGRLLSDAGYRTQMIGKWHCGDQPAFLPTNHGFDHYFGLPYSNDMGRQAGTRTDAGGRPALATRRCRCCSTTRCSSSSPTRRRSPRATSPRPSGSSAPRGDRPVLPVPRPPLRPPPDLRAGALRPASAQRRLRRRGGGDRLGHRRPPPRAASLGLDERHHRGVHERQRLARPRRRQQRAARGARRARPGRAACGCRASPAGRVASRRAGRPPSWRPSMDLYPTLAALCGAEVPDDRTIDGRDIRPLLLDDGADLAPRGVPLLLDERPRGGARPVGGSSTSPRHGDAVRELYDVDADPGETIDLMRPASGGRRPPRRPGRARPARRSATPASASRAPTCARSAGSTGRRPSRRTTPTTPTTPPSTTSPTAADPPRGRGIAAPDPSGSGAP